MTGTSAYSIRRGGIIAAGEGSRLRADGWQGSKPLVEVAGKPLIAHALDRLRAAEIARPCVIINQESSDSRQWLEAHGGQCDLVVRTTPSSYVSFQLVADRLAGAPCVITTVDSILPVASFCRFVDEAASFPKGAVVLGLTDHVDDEKPLWATLQPGERRIVKLGDDSSGLITGGLYALPANRPAAPSAGFDRLRDYLTWLVTSGFPVYGIVLPLVFDIDRARDIAAAEAQSEGGRE
jgi:NDP-sugar pyrophosphorylase family protein